MLMNSVDAIPSQIWFITGASSGFGRAFAEYALDQGHGVVVSARQVEKLDGLLARAPTQVLALAMDVTDPRQVEAGVATALERFGRVDVLINYAGYGLVGAVEETSEAELRALMETNFFGAMAVIRALLPRFRAQRGGAIVNIASMGGQRSFAGLGAYSASKFALEGASEALAQELAPFGVKVLMVESGAFRTDFAGDTLRHMPTLSAYQDTVGGTRASAQGMNSTQPVDPGKVAVALGEALASDNPPLRLVLGEDALEAVRDRSETLLAELDQWSTLLLSTAHQQ